MVSPEGDKALAIVIDDDSLIRFVLSAVLESNGYEVLGTATTAEALPSVARACLLILDATIPGERLESSLAAARAENDSVGIIVISGAPVHRDQLERSRAEFLLKPLSMDDLLTAATKVESS
jgi:DNA-binding NtrC family response regulator